MNQNTYLCEGMLIPELPDFPAEPVALPILCPTLSGYRWFYLQRERELVETLEWRDMWVRGSREGHGFRELVSGKLAPIPWCRDRGGWEEVGEGEE